ncbi:MAG: N-acetylmuramic acid 6-phosphate etherase [Anaerolineaceae bacterium]|nr:N-acetylmuramic acid 6-phosphate etherase [Anaerolineaceae bacterium]
MLTEQSNPRTTQIDQLSALDIVKIINAEDQLVAQAVAKVLPQIAQAVQAIAEAIRAGGRLIYVGAGTSGRLGVLDAAECVPTFSTPPEMVQALIAGGDRAMTLAMEGAEDNRQAANDDLDAIGLTAADVVVGIAASGRTPYVLAALEKANALGCVTAGVTCNAPSAILEIAQIGIAVLVGPEVISGSTRMKAGTAQKMVLNMLSTAAMIRLGKVYGNLMVDVRVTNEKLEQRARRIVARLTGLDESAAGELLQNAANEVKTAIVCHLRQVSPAEARALLREQNGRLRAVIGTVGEN